MSIGPTRPIVGQTVVARFKITNTTTRTLHGEWEFTWSTPANGIGAARDGRFPPGTVAGETLRSTVTAMTPKGRYAIYAEASDARGGSHAEAAATLRRAAAPANGRSSSPVVSADGRFVAFNSWASNLVAGDTNRHEDVFVWNRATGRMRRVSVSSANRQANNDSFAPAISADGRIVAFTSDASNLVSGDTNAHEDVLVRDRTRARTRRVSVSSNEAQGSGDSLKGAAISADGRTIVFASFASNLIAGDTSASLIDIFVRNRFAGTTQRVNVSSSGEQAAADSIDPAISADGSIIAFDSSAPNLVLSDTNNERDIFIRNRANHTTQRISVP